MSIIKKRFLIFSDVHYAGPGERRRGLTETDASVHPIQKMFVSVYRNFLWLADPLAHASNFRNLAIKMNSLKCDDSIFLGDTSMDTAFIGIADPLTLESAQEFMSLVQSHIDAPTKWVVGDHELGKTSMIGKKGGPRYKSVENWTEELNKPLGWSDHWHHWKLISVCSTLVGMPVFEAEILPTEKSLWVDAHENHIQWIKKTFGQIQKHERAILFCHDPSALGFMYGIPEVREKLDQIAVTWVGHMHTPLVKNAADLFAGIPPILHLGSSLRRYSLALQKAKVWKKFRMKLCPSPAGSELLRDGGFFEMTLSTDPNQKFPINVFHNNPWD